MRLTALVLFALLAAACGGDEPDEPPPPETAPQTAPPPAATDTAAEETGAMPEGDAGGAAPAEPRAQREDGRQARDADGRQSPAPAGGATEGQRLYTVQVAAFLQSSSASEWAARLESQGLPVWVSMAEIGGRTFHRLRVGAVPTMAEARRLGAMIMDRYEWPVWVAPLTPADRPPAEAVQDTRRLLESG